LGKCHWTPFPLELEVAGSKSGTPGETAAHTNT
jgi:hypothetical protein